MIAAMPHPNNAKNDKKRLLRRDGRQCSAQPRLREWALRLFPARLHRRIKTVERTATPSTYDLDGLDRTVQTDIGRDAKTGKPRGFFRERKWVRHFFEHHEVKPGALLALERLSERSYRLSVQPSEQTAPLECAEFFAGIGLVRLALERQEWRVVFANDIDPKKVEMYRHNWPNNDHLVVGDIHAIKADEVPSCTLFTASFPCNDLSIAGRWEGLPEKSRRRSGASCESSATWVIAGRRLLCLKTSLDS